MSVDWDSSAAEVIRRVDFLRQQEVAALERYLEEKTVHDLLAYPSAQTLANELETASRAQYEADVVEGNLAHPFPRDVDEYLDTVAPLKLRRIGAIAYQLLLYVHRMFDPIPTATPGVESC